MCLNSNVYKLPSCTYFGTYVPCSLYTHPEYRAYSSRQNCTVDFEAKRILLSMDANDLPCQQRFPLEAICVWAGREKLTLDTGHYIRYHAHCHLAREEFNTASLLNTAQFDIVDWQVVHNTLSPIPWMFQVWACKQVWSIAPTNYVLSHWTAQSPLCPSCMQVVETCEHVLHCNHAGQVDALCATIKLLDEWIGAQQTQT